MSVKRVPLEWCKKSRLDPRTVAGISRKTLALKTEIFEAQSPYSKMIAKLFTIADVTLLAYKRSSLAIIAMSASESFPQQRSTSSWRLRPGESVKSHRPGRKGEQVFRIYLLNLGESSHSPGSKVSERCASTM